jgi:subtilisin family serine protease
MTTPLVSLRPATTGALLGASVLVAGITAAPSVALAQQEEVDLYEANAWVIDQVNAEAAWETTKGEGVTVAVVDTGLAEEHPFLEDKDILPGKAFPDNGEYENAHVDTDGHGTGVAAAVLYAAPEATILPVRSFATGADIGFSTGATQNHFDGIRWAADNGADVIVIPWIEVMAGENREPSQEFLGTVQYAIDKDVVVIAGGGNDPELDQVPNPAYFPGVVAVSGTDKSGDAWSMNTTGPEIVLAGPADAMLFPIPQVVDFGEEPLYFEAAGTSAAAGVVGGVAALVRAAHPDLDASNTIQRLIATADDHGEGRTEALGFGAVDADAAVNSSDVEAVVENPLGYPLGEAGASSEISGDESAEPAGDTSSEADPRDQAAESGDSTGGGLLPVIVVGAAVVLAVAGLVVWLVLLSRSKTRSRVQPWQQY